MASDDTANDLLEAMGHTAGPQTQGQLNAITPSVANPLVGGPQIDPADELLEAMGHAKTVAPPGQPLPGTVGRNIATAAATVGSMGGASLLGRGALALGAQAPTGYAELLAAAQRAGSSVPRLRALGQAISGAFTNPVTAARVAGAFGGGAAGAAAGGERTPQELLTRGAAGAVGEGVGQGLITPGLGAATEIARKLPVVGAPFRLLSGPSAGLTAEDAAAGMASRKVLSGGGSEAWDARPTLTPYQINPNSTGLRNVEGLLEKTWLGAPILAKNRLDVGKTVELQVHQLVNGLSDGGTNQRVVGEMLDDTLGDAAKIARKHQSWVWSTMLQNADNAGAMLGQADLAPIVQQAADLFGEIPAASRDLSLNTPFASNIQRLINNTPRQMTFSDGDQLRKDLYGMADRTGNNRWKLLGKSVENALGDAADAAGPGVRTDWDNARNFTKQAFGDAQFNWNGPNTPAGKYTGTVLKEVLDRASPETIAASLGKVDATQLDKVRSILGANSDVWETVQGSELRSAMAPRSDTDPRLDFDKMLTNLQTMGRDGRLESIFPDKADRDTIMNMLAMGARSQREARMGIGSLYVQGEQFGAGRTILKMAPGWAKAAAAVFLPQRILARAWTNPSIVRWLVYGSEAVPGTRFAAKAAAGLYSQLKAAGILGMPGVEFKPDDPQGFNDFINQRHDEREAQPSRDLLNEAARSKQP